MIGARSAGNTDVETIRRALRDAADYLRTSRPTAVNLFWALDRMERTSSAEADLDGSVAIESLTP